MFDRERVTEVACWAHARRKFYDAQDSDAKRAAEMLALVGQLYAVEREAKENNLDEAATLGTYQGSGLVVGCFLWESNLGAASRTQSRFQT